MKYQIVTHNQIVGYHRWPDAPARFAYLSDSHRHVFVIRCKFDVTHTDREIEINDMQYQIENHLRERFGAASQAYINFRGMSCEDIAAYCIEKFSCTSCEVLEDGFGGAYVRK